MLWRVRIFYLVNLWPVASHCVFGLRGFRYQSQELTRRKPSKSLHLHSSMDESQR